MKSAEEERDTIKQDLKGSDLGKDEVIKKAWETRDAAVKRKNASEVELAKERIAVMQVVNYVQCLASFSKESPLSPQRSRLSDLRRHSPRQSLQSVS